ncbi:unnamed protein product [Victoria cruziana]
MEHSAAIAQQTWELENSIVSMDVPDSDSIYFYDEAVQTKTQQEKPWSSDPHYFKKVKISALALLKMVVHARSGGTIEVMGLMQGKTDGDTIIVMDAFALPVEGTETRVNAQADAYEYMVDYSQTNKQYYALDITYFKSSLDSHLLDLLWNKYWVNTLSSSPLLGNRDYVAGQISDLGKCYMQSSWMVIKDILFNTVRQSTRAVQIPNELSGPEPMVES